MAEHRPIDEINWAH